MNFIRTHLLTVLAGLLVITIYSWFISAGRWTAWSDTTTFYNQLAESFQHGQLSLQTRPDPILATLSNPYDPQARLGLQYPWDISFYRGRYYLYWGPVPALLLLFAKVFIPGVIGDQYLVFAFTAGIFAFQTLLLLAIWRRYYQDLPRGLLVTGILMAGCLSPLLWDLNRPTIYEAAITAGQFFFIGGFYFAFTALEKRPPSRWRLILAGVYWSLAVGSRVSQIVPVGSMVVLILVYLSRTGLRGIGPVKNISAGAYLFIPILLGGMSLAWYNWARFGSITDFGFTYQLTGRDLQTTSASLYSPIYIPQNVYNYLLNPFGIQQRFPFIKPLSGKQGPLFPDYGLPTYYMVEDEITGLVYSAPFLLFAILPLTGLAGKSRAKYPGEIRTSSEPEQGFKIWTETGLAISMLSGFVPLLVFFYAAPRYVVDFLGPLSILAAMGFWEFLRLVAQRPPYQKIFLPLAAVLATLSISLGSVLAFTSHIGRFKYFNPDLVKYLSNLFVR